GAGRRAHDPVHGRLRPARERSARARLPGYRGLVADRRAGSVAGAPPSRRSPMSTRHLVDPEIAPMLDTFPPIILNREQLPQIRAGLAEMNSQMASAAPAFPEIEVSERLVPGPAGAPDVPVLVYLPKNAQGPLPALLWIHGGGYVLGSAAQDDLNVKAIV